MGARLHAGWSPVSVGGNDPPQWLEFRKSDEHSQLGKLEPHVTRQDLFGRERHAHGFARSGVVRTSALRLFSIHLSTPSLLYTPSRSRSQPKEGPFPWLSPAFIMADDIVIDKQLFHERLSSFVTKWKADKRSGDQIFQGAGAIATVVGKASEPGSYLKPAAFQVGLVNGGNSMDER